MKLIIKFFSPLTISNLKLLYLTTSVKFKRLSPLTDYLLMKASCMKQGKTG